MDGSDILPALFQERDQKVDGLDEIGLNLFFLHGLLADGDLDVDNFFKLEFDGSFKSIMYLADVITFSDGLWGLTTLDERSTHSSNNGFHEGVRGQENSIFRRPLFCRCIVYLGRF